ncbi:Substrate-specific component PdxU of predicted pyridoxine ECF transporter [Leuconostoc inhae]|nr:ECF transporter S component [Leuconostoc gasicomitatum]CUW13988.1 Substrate-specific component PdxU of predicted pyridoxine ECF transporter [Leuconostoc inhae]
MSAFFQKNFRTSPDKNKKISCKDLHFLTTYILVVLLGYKRGAIAGGMGLALFDVTHNYVLDAPYYFFEVFVVGGLATLVIQLLNYRAKPQSFKLILIILAAIIAKFVTTTLHNFIMSLIRGLTLQPAIVATLSALVPTIVNCVTTMIVVLIIYPILNGRLRNQLFSALN